MRHGARQGSNTGASSPIRESTAPSRVQCKKRRGGQHGMALMDVQASCDKAPPQWLLFLGRHPATQLFTQHAFGLGAGVGMPILCNEGLLADIQQKVATQCATQHELGQVLQQPQKKLCIAREAVFASGRTCPFGNLQRGRRLLLAVERGPHGRAVAALKPSASKPASRKTGLL